MLMISSSQRSGSVEGALMVFEYGCIVFVCVENDTSPGGWQNKYCKMKRIVGILHTVSPSFYNSENASK